MKSLILILFTILYFAYKQYKKSLKLAKPNIANNADKPMPENAAVKSPNERFTLNDFINDFVEKKINVPPAMTNENINGEWEVDFRQDENQDIDNEVIVAKENREADLVQQNEIQFGIDTNKPKNRMEATDFDLKKAVVYEAILNPPYI